MNAVVAPAMVKDKEVDYSDSHLVAALKARNASGDRKRLLNCWAACSGMANAKSETHTDYSNPGASANLHAERNSIGKYAAKLGIVPSGAKNSGPTMGAFLQSKHVAKLTVFTELPPCPACRTWLTQISMHGIRINIKYPGGREDYFKKNEYQKKKSFREWIEDDLKWLEANS